MVSYMLETLDGLGEILGGVDEGELEALLEQLEQSWREGGKVFVLAVGRANLVMRTFAMRLMQIGLNAYVVYDTNTPALEAGDLLIAGSGSGSTGTVVGIAAKAKRLGARLVLLSRTADGELAAMADAVVRIPTERRSKKLHTKGSEFEQSLFVLCDTVGVHLIRRLGLIEDIEDIDPFIQIRHANLQ